MKTREYLESAISIIGGQKQLATICGRTQGAVSQWLTAGRVPANHCIIIEQATEGRVTRYQLRPDIFGEPFRR